MDLGQFLVTENARSNRKKYFFLLQNFDRLGRTF